MVDQRISLPQRSEGGLAAADVFYRSYNEFYFYVEDEDQENLYFSILKKIFPHVSFEKIFPLGGKPSVLAHAKDQVSQSLDKRVYILDKDFDDLLGIKEEIRGVFYLDKFCIENYLLKEEALIEIVVESNPKQNRASIRDNLSLETKIPLIGGNLRTLFGLFFFVQLERLGIKNCKCKPEAFCKQNELWDVCPTLLNNYLDKILIRCAELGTEAPKKQLENDARLASYFLANGDEIVSGKFWLAMLFHYVKSKYNLGNITFDSFVFRLSKNCSFEDLGALVDEVQATFSA